MNLSKALFTVVVLCLQLSQRQHSAQGDEGSNGSPLQSADVLLLFSGHEEAAEWFRVSSEDALLAARLACSDVAVNDSFLVSVEIMEVPLVHSWVFNHSVVGIVSAQCTDNTCQAQLPSQGLNLPVISYSPSCLRGSGNDTAMVEGSAEVALYQPFCMLPSLKHLPAGLAALVSHFNWQRAAIISEEDSHLIANPEDICSELSRAGVGDVKKYSISAELIQPRDILHRDYRIVILNLTPSLSRQVMCEAVHQNLSQYVWILPGWYPHGWWLASTASQSQLSCSDNVLEKFIGEGNVLSVLQSPLQLLISHESRMRSVRLHQRFRSSGITDLTYASLAYDAVWTIVTALNDMILLPSELHGAVTDSDFTGLSGQVQFDSAGYRVWGSYIVSQMRYDERLESVPIATIMEGGEDRLLFTYTFNESEDSVWPDGVPPDGSPIEVTKHPLLALVIICYVLSGVVILWAIVCIVFNICFRKKKLIKLTSPTLNYMIAVGVILMNLGTPMTMYPAALESALMTLCILRPWIFPIGFSLSLCTISVKMWRVFIIYRTTKKLQTLRQKRLRNFLCDWHMIILILSLVVVDVIVLVVATSIPSTRFYSERVLDKEFSAYRNSDDIEVVYYNVQCVSDHGLIWVTLLFGYKVVLQITGMVLAFLTRKVKVRGLNESLEVQLVMFITTPIVVVALTLRLVFSDYLNVVGTLYALGVALVGGATLGIIFIPKMVGLCRNPSGNLIYLSKSHHSTSCSNVTSHRDRSFTTSSLLSNSDPTSSLRSLFKRPSMESVVAPSEGDQMSERGRTNTLSKTVLFSLPTIEESPCIANDAATTDCGESTAEVEPFTLQVSDSVSSEERTTQ